MDERDKDGWMDGWMQVDPQTTDQAPPIDRAARANIAEEEGEETEEKSATGQGMKKKKTDRRK